MTSTPKKIKRLNSQPTQTKVCPYCAETIKSAAVVCRFCGSDLTGNKPKKSNDDTLDKAVAWYIERGWVLSARTGSSLHFHKPKPWSYILIGGGILSLILGFFYLPLFGLGFILLLLSVLDHVIRPDKKLNVTINELEAGKAPTGNDPLNTFIIILAAVAFVICAIAYQM